MFTTDIILESTRVIILLILVVFLWRLGRKKDFISTGSWKCIQVGFVLILFGSMIDITDNFESLNAYVVIGDTEPQAFLEKVVGYLMGFSFLTVGLLRWAPTVERLMKEINERKFAENQNKLLLGSVYEGILGINEKGVVTFANPSASRMFEKLETDMIGHPLRAASRLSNSNGSNRKLTTYDFVAEIFSHEGPHCDEVEFLRNDDSTFTGEYTATPIFECDELSGAILHFRDITQRLVAEKAKSNFLSTISHELRTPLTSIKGSVDLIGTGTIGEVPDGVKPLIVIAQKNCTRMLHLVDDLLDCGKQQAGNTNLSFEDVDLSSTLRSSMNKFTSLGEEAGVAFELSGDTNSLPILGDKYRLAQVMDKLLSNAVKFSKRGAKVEITLSSKQGFAHVSVKDTGNGIPEIARTTVFDSFMQADSSDTRKVQGTGLGLSIAKSIVEAHGGSIDFTSVIGKGTTFFFSLPKSQCEDLTAPLVQSELIVSA